MVVVVEKVELGNFGGEGKECSLILQVARLLVDIRGLKD
jgi:hypothetical protein